MLQYNVPPDTSAKEKLVGGILDVSQLLFLLAGVACGLALGFFLKIFLDVFGLVIGVLLGAGVGLFLGFFKIHELSVIGYLKAKKKHKNKTKKLPNVRLEALTTEQIDEIKNF